MDGADGIPVLPSAANDDIRHQFVFTTEDGTPLTLSQEEAANLIVGKRNSISVFSIDPI
jgi:hypothetical protein